MLLEEMTKLLLILFNSEELLNVNIFINVGYILFLAKNIPFEDELPNIAITNMSLLGWSLLSKIAISNGGRPPNGAT